MSESILVGLVDTHALRGRSSGRHDAHMTAAADSPSSRSSVVL